MRIVARTALAGLALVIGLACVSAGVPAWADPPGGFGDRHHHGHDRHEARDHGPRRGHARAEDFRFGDRDRVAIRNYYSHYGRDGRCPPGLAKKHDRCLPPGQARHWRVGERLPRGVTYYAVPPALVVQLQPPPVGYRYVRVGTDILMIAAGTGMVAAAIQDLAR